MNRRLHEALIHVQLAARGLFYSIEPYLQSGDPYGTIEMDSEEIAQAVHATTRCVQQALYQLRKHKILVLESSGYRCSLMQDERRNLALREEIRTIFARFTTIHVSEMQEDGSESLCNRNGKSTNGFHVR